MHAILVGDQIWLTNAERDWTWNSLSVFGPKQESMIQGSASMAGIVTVGAGVVLVGSTYPGTGAPPKVAGWAMEFDSAGQMVWDHHGTVSEVLSHLETAVAIDARGRIRTAGVGWTSDGASIFRSCIMER